MSPLPLVALLWLSGCGGLAGKGDDPGRVTMHRLNRAEYNNTVRDLLQTNLQPARAFPEDDFGNGFDNQAAVLSMSPLHVEMYEAAADDLVGRPDACNARFDAAPAAGGGHAPRPSQADLRGAAATRPLAGRKRQA